MQAVEIKKDVFWIGVNDRTTDLFEGIWPIAREGVSYNAYLIRDDKNVLIDLSKSIKTGEFIEQIARVVKPSDLDYIVINHMEPDHTGVMRLLKMLCPKAVILSTAKAVKMLKDFYGVDQGVQEVSDGETLSLGKRQLQFFHTPFVHWPETMMTYVTGDKILFSCDGFGGYGALRGYLFDDECTDYAFYEKESLRYFVNIVAKFTTPVLKAIDKLGSIPVEIIAPSHGLIWRKNPGRIIELYKKWSEYARGDNESGITLIYGSMYGNTEKMMNAVTQGISRAGVPVNIYDSARTHVSYILPSLWVNKAVMIGAPTYEGGVFPPIAHVLETAALKRIVNKKAAMFGSHGWGGGALRRISSIIDPLKWQMTDTLEFTGGPSNENLAEGESFGTRFAEAIKS